MPVENTAFEKHYRIGEIARMWGLGRETVRKLVKDDPGVIKIRMGRKHAHTIYSIPESAARRIYFILYAALEFRLRTPARKRHTLRLGLVVEGFLQDFCEPGLALRNPRRVMLAYHLFGVTQQFSYVAHSNARSLQENSGECMPEAVGRRLVVPRPAERP